MDNTTTPPSNLTTSDAIVAIRVYHKRGLTPPWTVVRAIMDHATEYGTGSPLYMEAMDIVDWFSYGPVPRPEEIPILLTSAQFFG